MDNYYDILGVEESASDADIKKSFRTLAKQWHPDKNNSPEAKEKFQKINKANQILSDKAKRAEYDQQRKGGFGSHTFGHGFGRGAGVNMEDIINEMFRQHSNRQQQHQTIYQLSISLKEAFTGCSKVVNKDTVRIPAGIRDGNRLKVGSNIYSIRVWPDPKYERQNDHLISVIQINSFDAMLGNEIKYIHLDDKEYKIKIPAGTQHGDKLRLQRTGMPNPEIAGLVGDLYIICVIKTPENLTSDQKSAILDIYTPTTLTL